MTKQETNQAIIEYLVTQVIEKAQLNKSGSAALVPSVSGFESGKMHRVELDENYLIDSCTCLGGKHGECSHKAAVRRYFAAKGPALLDSKSNPVYQFQRNGKTVKARLSQFSKEEKKALRQYEQEAAKRAIYEQAFNPHCVA